MTDRKISLRVVTAPRTGILLEAPPVLNASDHSVDYTCGRCGTILLHAEEHQVHGVLIRCANWDHTIQRTLRPRGPRSNSGSLAMLAAIRRASSCVNSFAADRRPGSFSK